MHVVQRTLEHVVSQHSVDSDENDEEALVSHLSTLKQLKPFLVTFMMTNALYTRLPAKLISLSLVYLL
jgi:hypothetical protein